MMVAAQGPISVTRIVTEQLMDGSYGSEVTGSCDHGGHWKFKGHRVVLRDPSPWKALVTGGYFEISAHWELVSGTSNH